MHAGRSHATTPPGRRHANGLRHTPPRSHLRPSQRSSPPRHPVRSGSSTAAGLAWGGPHPLGVAAAGMVGGAPSGPAWCLGLLDAGVVDESLNRDERFLHVQWNGP